MSERKIILLTGAFSGIGRATAEKLAARGHKVYGTSRDPKGKTVPAGVVALALDVRDETSIAPAVARIIEDEGRIDVLVNNAGYILTGGIEETTPEEASAQFETNFFGLHRVTRAVLPHMRRRAGGRIVNVSSLVGHAPIPFAAFYSASKFALEGYSESLAHELAPFGIDVAMVEPGFVRTPLAEHALAAANPLPAYAPWRTAVEGRIEAQIAKAIEPGEVAAVIARLIEARAPALRNFVGGDARLVRRLRRLVPPRLFFRIWRRQFGLDKANAGASVHAPVPAADSPAGN